MADSTMPSGNPSAATTPAAAPAEASSSTVQQDQQQLRTPLDLRRAIEQMKAAGPIKASAPAPEAAPAPAAVEETPAAEPEVTVPAEGEETPAAEPGAEPAPAEGDEDDGGEGPVTPLTGKRVHLRVPDNEVDKLALALQRRNRDWTLEQSLEAAKKQLGISTQKQEGETPETPAKPKLPDTPEAVQTTIAEKLVAYKKAMAEVRFEDAADLQAEILELQGHRSTLERRAEQQKVQEAQKYDAEFDASVAKAADLYPFAADLTSPGAKRMAEIDEQLKKLDDPLYYSPNKPLKLAQMAAAELNIAPKSKTAAPAKPAAVQPQAQAPKKGIVPAGSGRTTPPATNQPAVDPAIAAIKTPLELRAQLKRFGVRV